MVRKMLEPNSKKRITFDEALCHPFIETYGTTDVML